VKFIVDCPSRLAKSLTPHGPTNDNLSVQVPKAQGSSRNKAETMLFRTLKLRVSVRESDALGKEIGISKQRVRNSISVNFLIVWPSIYVRSSSAEYLLRRRVRSPIVFK
jgi:hypothetical protein